MRIFPIIFTLFLFPAAAFAQDKEKLPSERKMSELYPGRLRDAAAQAVTTGSDKLPSEKPLPRQVTKAKAKAGTGNRPKRELPSRSKKKISELVKKPKRKPIGR